MKFTDLKECPFCGNDIFYSKLYVRGNVCYRYRFDGKEEMEASATALGAMNT